MKKTIKQLMDEIDAGKRLLVTREEIDAARDYERSLLPPSAVYPKDGEIWESTTECEVTFFAEFLAPGGGPTGHYQFPPQQQVRVAGTVEDRPILVSFVPINFAEFEQRIVPNDTRANPRYDTYWLAVSTAEFNACFKRMK